MVTHIPTRAGRVAAELAGKGTPLFLLPANGHERRDFDLLVPLLSPMFQTVAIDWPGFGDSDDPPAPSSATASLFYDVFQDVFDALALGPALIVGHSVGGMVSVRFAAERPGDVRAIAIVDSGGFHRTGIAARLACRLIGTELFMRAITPAFTGWYLKRVGPPTQLAVERARRKLAKPTSIAVEAAVWRSFARPESTVSEMAPRVKCPVLVLWGRSDPVVPLGDGERAHSLLPSSRIVTFDTGHAPFLEDPAAFAPELIAFLRGGGSGARA
jgi:pimeloyl-ACP methyl ester carboxylesterase